MSLEDEELDLRVVGWHERHRPTLIELFENIDRIGPSLSEIRFETDGSLWLVTRDLGGLRLGSDQTLLERQIQVVEHLSRSLPEQMKRRRPQLIDLSDPEQPELSLPGAAKTPAKAGQATPREQPAGSLGRLPTANAHRPLPSCPIRANWDIAEPSSPGHRHNAAEDQRHPCGRNHSGSSRAAPIH